LAKSILVSQELVLAAISDVFGDGHFVRRGLRVSHDLNSTSKRSFLENASILASNGFVAPRKRLLNDVWWEARRFPAWCRRKDVPREAKVRRGAFVCGPSSRIWAYCNEIVALAQKDLQRYDFWTGDIGTYQIL
jgi:hypothetical protein